ncbi:MAG: class B sortase [Oscillospiraceae bacterium]|nr:class B sortase [Oscillospiraceae bacterium]
MKVRELIGRKTIKLGNIIVNIIVQISIVLLTAYAGYALWDSKELHQAADKSQYAIYKPTAENEGKSFEELQALNPEVIAWLTVFNTNIDYPVTQGDSNMKYINTNAEGQYSLSGAIFLDYTNSKDFSDFNNILYGHHMARNTMFGDLDTFADKSKFDANRYGNLYFDRQDHEIEFFAFLRTDAYDSSIFKAGVEGEGRQGYLDVLSEKMIHTRDIGISVSDRIVLLSTCSDNSTNGRDILVGRLNDKPHEETAEDVEGVSDDREKDESCQVSEISIWTLLALIMLTVIITIKSISICRKYRKTKNDRRRRGSKNEQSIEDYE